MRARRASRSSGKSSGTSWSFIVGDNPCRKHRIMRKSSNRYLLRGCGTGWHNQKPSSHPGEVLLMLLWPLCLEKHAGISAKESVWKLVVNYRPETYDSTMVCIHTQGWEDRQWHGVWTRHDTSFGQAFTAKRIWVVFNTLSNITNIIMSYVNFYPNAIFSSLISCERLKIHQYLWTWYAR